MHKESDCHEDHVNQLSLPETVCYVDESFDERLICEKFLTIVQNTQLLSRQGLAFRGNNNEGNFEQLMKLIAKDGPRITSWMEKKSEKSSYLHHDTQNEIIRFMSFIILRDIATNINGGIFYLIMANEMGHNFWFLHRFSSYCPSFGTKYSKLWISKSWTF